MKLADSLLTEFDQEMAATRRVLERLPEQHLMWKPHPKSWPLASLATHVMMIPHWGWITLTQDSYDLSPTGGAPETPKPIDCVQEALERFDHNVVEARAALAASSDAQLTVYLRLLDQPLPAIYGPSADERS